MYQAADLAVETSQLSVAAVADRVVAFIKEREGREQDPDGAAGADPQAPQRIRVDLGARGYDVWIGRGVIADAAGYLTRCGIRGRLALLTHARIDALYGRALAAGLRGAGYQGTTLAVAPAGAGKRLRLGARPCDAPLQVPFA